MAEKQSPKTRDERIDAFILNWDKNYVRWSIVFFLGLSIYRTTTDGLWFIAFVVISFASNLESHVKLGTPLIRDRKKNQKIREFGVGRAISKLFLTKLSDDDSPLVRRYGVMPPNLMYVFVGRAVNTLLLLHLYILLLIIFDFIDRELLRSIIVQFNKPFELIIDNWHGLHGMGRSASKLRSHYYSDLVPVLEHLYIVTMVFCSFYLIGVMNYVVKPAFFRGYIKHFASVKTTFEKRNKKSLAADMVASPVGRFIVGIFMCGYGVLFIYIYEPALHFEGEPHSRHGRYIWMYNYMYKDYLGYFTPAYYLSLFFAPFISGVVVLSEIPCRFYVYIKERIGITK